MSVSEPESKRMGLFGRNGGRRTRSVDDHVVRRINNNVSFLGMGVDDSSLGPTGGRRNRPKRRPKSPKINDESLDTDLASETRSRKSSRRSFSSTGSRLADLVRRKLLTPHGRKKAGMECASHSFDSDDGEYRPSWSPRSILKNATTPPQQQRSKPQLMTDFTQLPYTAALTLPGSQSRDEENEDSDDGNELDLYGYGDQPPRQITTNEQLNGQRRPGGQRARYSVYQGNVKPKYRVRPYRCFPDGRTMTEEEIYKDSLKPSRDFVQLKSYLLGDIAATSKIEVPKDVEKLFGSPQLDGRIGAIRVEVLGCVSLARTKPDIAVYLVCGDAAFSTDVLTGYRSPMWPHESRRACVFPLHHAYLQLYVGVFDVRVRNNKDNDVFCGRVVLDIARLRSDTEYDVTFPLRASAFVYDRRKRGVIRLRFSLHWFSERAAICSYFKSPKTASKNIPLHEGFPTIPCGDPKTFRNVAITVYGQDLPGKYSKAAFRAVSRELTLYQQNLPYILKALALDAILYERLHISLYLFGAGMFCVVTNSIHMVPAFFVGYILLLYIENYLFYVHDTKYNLGYRPHSLQEIVNGLIQQPDEKATSFYPILLEKKTKRKKGGSADDSNNNEWDIEPVDHREFPFSERDAYPKFAVEHSLAPSTKKAQEGTTRLHGRLSVYYAATPATMGGDEGAVDDDDDDSDDSGERDDETVMGGTDSMFGFDDLDDNLDDEQDGIPVAYQEPDIIQPSAAKRRIRLGPPQDADISSRKVPPQLQVQKMEKMFHKASFKISVEVVHPPLADSTATGTTDSVTTSTSLSAELEKAMQDQNAALKKKKAVYDEFDRLLGLQSRSANPVMRFMTTFLGPLMRMIRVFVFVFRIAFHIATWKDPFLSFWVLVVLSALFLILIIFPWRAFFFLAITASFGPQNIFVRKYLEKKAAQKAQENNGSDDTSVVAGDTTGPAPLLPAISSDSALDTTSKKKNWGGSYPFFSSNYAKDRERSNNANSTDMATENSIELDRQPFRPDHHASASSSKRFRSVVIPYSKMKKDRFFDWPPDPTVSRATPLPFRELPQEKIEPEPVQHPFAPVSRAVSERSLFNPETSRQSEIGGDQIELPRGLRKRAPAKRPGGVPANLYI